MVIAANQVAASVIGPEATWTNLGPDEDYNVTINSATKRICVEHIYFDDEAQDWCCDSALTGKEAIAWVEENVPNGMKGLYQ